MSKDEVMTTVQAAELLREAFTSRKVPLVVVRDIGLRYKSPYGAVFDRGQLPLNPNTPSLGGVNLAGVPGALAAVNVLARDQDDDTPGRLRREGWSRQYTWQLEAVEVYGHVIDPDMVGRLRAAVPDGVDTLRIDVDSPGTVPRDLVEGARQIIDAIGVGIPAPDGLSIDPSGALAILAFEREVVQAVADLREALAANDWTGLAFPARLPRGSQVRFTVHPDGRGWRGRAKDAANDAAPVIIQYFRQHLDDCVLPPGVSISANGGQIIVTKEQ